MCSSSLHSAFLSHFMPHVKAFFILIYEIEKKNNNKSGLGNIALDVFQQNFFNISILSRENENNVEEVLKKNEEKKSMSYHS